MAFLACLDLRGVVGGGAMGSAATLLLPLLVLASLAGTTGVSSGAFSALGDLLLLGPAMADALPLPLLLPMPPASCPLYASHASYVAAILGCRAMSLRDGSRPCSRWNCLRKVLISRANIVSMVGEEQGGGEGRGEENGAARGCRVGACPSFFTCAAAVRLWTMLFA